MSVHGAGQGSIGLLSGGDGDDAFGLNSYGLIFQFVASRDVDDGDVTNRYVRCRFLGRGERGTNGKHHEEDGRASCGPGGIRHAEIMLQGSGRGRVIRAWGSELGVRAWKRSRLFPLSKREPGEPEFMLVPQAFLAAVNGAQ